jgi:hypothetical protein
LVFLVFLAVLIRALPKSRALPQNSGAFTRSTASQCKAIYAIARANGVHLGDYLHQRYQTALPDEHTVRHASGETATVLRMIDFPGSQRICVAGSASDWRPKSSFVLQTHAQGAA